MANTETITRATFVIPAHNNAPSASNGLARAIIVLFCLCLFFNCVSLFYPGAMTNDSKNQLNEARTAKLDVNHPPLMAFLWKKLDSLSPGPQGMLIFHNFLFWLGVTLVGWPLCRRYPWLGISTPLFFLWPNIVVDLNVIWKDIGMGSSLLLASACLIFASQKPFLTRRVYCLLSLPFLYYGISVRFNAIFAVYPLCVYGVSLVTNPSMRFFKKTLWALVPFFSLALAAIGTAHLIAKGKEFHTRYIALHDLSGIYVKSGRNFFPPSITGLPDYSPQQITTRYTPSCGNSLFWGWGKDAVIGDSHFLNSWVTAVRQAPLAYLAHRTEVFKSFMRWGEKTSCDPFVIVGDGMLPMTRAQGNFYQMIQTLSSTWIFRPWFWAFLGMGIAVISFLLRKPFFAATLALVASALSYLLAYYPIGVCCDFRYAWWSTVAIALSLYLVSCDYLISKWNGKSR